MASRAKKPRRKVYQTPERAKNGRSRRRILLSKAETGQKWRYGIAGQQRVEE